MLSADDLEDMYLAVYEPLLKVPVIGLALAAIWFFVGLGLAWAVFWTVATILLLPVLLLTGAASFISKPLSIGVFVIGLVLWAVILFGDAPEDIDRIIK